MPSTSSVGKGDKQKGSGRVPAKIRARFHLVERSPSTLKKEARNTNAPLTPYPIGVLGLFRFHAGALFFCNLICPVLDFLRRALAALSAAFSPATKARARAVPPPPPGDLCEAWAETMRLADARGWVGADSAGPALELLKACCTSSALVPTCVISLC